MTVSDAVTGSPLGHAFLSEGEPLVVGGNRPIDLSTRAVWLVTSGRLDLFAVVTERSGDPGCRRHLVRASAGEVVFGAQRQFESRVRVIGVGTGETGLLRVSWESLDRLEERFDLMGEIARAVDRWVDLLHQGIVARRMFPGRCTELSVGSEAVLRPGDAARPATGVGWIRHLDGHSHLLGLTPLLMNGSGWIPLSPRGWTQAEGPCRVELQATHHIPIEQRWDGLQRLYELVIRHAELDDSRQESEESERIRRRLAAARTAVQDACRRLLVPLERDVSGAQDIEPTVTLSADSSVSPLWRCCRLVANACGIQVRSNDVPVGGGINAELRAMARRSRFRFRTVALRDGWWNSSGEPLLAFTANGSTPLALLPRKGRGYLIHDGITADARHADEADLDTLAPFAFSFYRPFPERAVRLWDVLRFGFAGSGRDLAVLLLAGATVGLLGLVAPIATGVIFNSVIPAADRGQLLQLVLVLLVCAFAASSFQLTRGIAQLRLEGRMGAAVQAAVWDRLLSLPMSFFRPFSAGDLAVRAMGIDAIRQTLSGATLTALLAGLFSITNFALLFVYSVRLAIWATLLAATAAGITFAVSWAQLRHQREIARFQQEISGQVLQYLGSIAKLQVAGAEAHAFAAWARKFSVQRTLQYRARRMGNVLTTFNAAFPVLSTATIFAAAAPLLQGDTALRTGDFLAFMSSFTIFLTAILSMTSAIAGVLAVVPLYENARPILASVPEVDEEKTDPGPLAGSIEVSHLSFRYQPSGPLILRDLSFRVDAGEFVALVGPSGTGKSTIFRLLLGFERPESGSIYFDGQELGGLDAQAVRQQIGVVLQNGRLMPGDVFTNIVGSSAATLGQAWSAAEMAGLADEVREMPMGMHTVISEGGSTLSGGQRQRLMIARAVVNRPRILLFDEATSALDNRTQALVSRSLEGLQASRIVIAHRLSTIVNADRIMVFDGGAIVECGSYSELMRRGGRFAALATRQLV